jgi:iron complex transport system substrate-binding protein
LREQQTIDFYADRQVCSFSAIISESSKHFMKKKRRKQNEEKKISCTHACVYAACGNVYNGRLRNTTSQTNSESSYDGQLVFDHAMELQYAKLFSVEYYKGGYKLLTITNRDEDTAIVAKQSKILLVPEGMSTPSGLDADTLVLKTPVTNLLVSSTPVTSLMNASNCLSNISQVTYDKDSWYIDGVKKAFDDGKLTYVGDYKAPDYETIIAGAPTLAIYSTMLTSKPDVAEKFKELGINYILDQSTYEENPLGRVEWAKFYAALCNEEDAATTMYNAQAAYVDTLSKAEKTGKSVAVFYITSKGKLYVRNAGDYLTQMVNMAGEYIFSDLNTDKTGTQEMNIESFYEKAKDADYVIYIWSLGGKPSTLSDFTGYNNVLSDMKAVKDGNVWCTTPDFFQIADTIGSMINDINLMLNADANTTELTYLKKLQ